jgi:hypothetical protein
MDTILGVLVESSVRATVIATAVACVLWGMCVKSPAIRHRAWTGVLLAMLLLPILSLWAPRIAIPLLPPDPGFQMKGLDRSTPKWNTFTKFKEVVPTIAATNPDVSGPVESLLPGAIKNQPTSTLGTYEIVAILYLTGFCILMARLLVGTLLSYRLTRNAPRDDKGFYCS